MADRGPCLCRQHSTAGTDNLPGGRGSVWRTRMPLVQAEEIFSCSCLDPIFQNKPCSCQAGYECGNIGFNTATGCRDGKVQVQFLLAVAAARSHCSPKSSDIEDCNCSSRCFHWEQLQQHILTSVYLCRTHFYCNGILSPWVHCLMIWMLTVYVQLLC